MSYVFKRMADPKVECLILSTLQDYVVGLKEAYAEALKNGDLIIPGRCRIEIVDRYTLVCACSYPQPLLVCDALLRLYSRGGEYYDGKVHEGAQRAQFVSRGGVPSASRSGGARLIRLARFDRYNATTFPREGLRPPKPASSAGGKPLPFDEIQPDHPGKIPWLLFRQGYLDRRGRKDTLDAVISVQELTPEFRSLGIELYKDAEPSTYFLIFNMEDPVVGKNKKLR